MELKQPEILRKRQKFITGDKKEFLMSFSCHFDLYITIAKLPINLIMFLLCKKRFSLVSLGHLWLYFALHVSSKLI